MGVDTREAVPPPTPPPPPLPPLCVGGTEIPEEGEGVLLPELLPVAIPTKDWVKVGVREGADSVEGEVISDCVARGDLMGWALPVGAPIEGVAPIAMEAVGPPPKPPDFEVKGEREFEGEGDKLLDLNAVLEDEGERVGATKDGVRGAEGVEMGVREESPLPTPPPPPALLPLGDGVASRGVDE